MWNFELHHSVENINCIKKIINQLDFFFHILYDTKKNTKNDTYMDIK